MNSSSETHWPPRGLTGLLVRTALPDTTRPTTPDARSRIGLLQGAVSIIVNVALFLVKGVLGLLLGSVALLADAIHSLSDVGSSLVVVFGFLWARKPRDTKHPFGHGRIEFITALVVAVLLIIMAIEFARIGFSRIIDPQIYTAPWWMIAAVVATLFVKQWVSVFANTLARATGSQALKADYWHHVTDVLSTGLVIAALIASRAGWPGADGWAGIGVSLFILYTGICTARDAISPLLGEAPAPEEVARIERAARSIRGVRGVHDLILHQYGDDRLMSLHIEVDANKSALEVHDIAEQVEDQVERAMSGKAIVHVDPVDRAHPQYAEAEDVMRDVVSDHIQLSEFHDLRVDGPAHGLTLSVDVVAVLGTNEADYPEIERRVKNAILEAMSGIDAVQVTVETGYHPK